MAMLNYNGPFFDEAIYIVAGVRTFEGHALSDLYLTWLAGTLAWPVLAGLGYLLGGIIGTRAIAALLGIAVLSAIGRATTNLFDEKAGFWATLALAVNGPFLALSRLGVYDILSLAGIAASFWAITELPNRNRRHWLLIAAVAYAIGALAKYPIGLMILPLMGTLVFLRKERARMDLLILIFVGGAVGLAFFLPLREQISVFFDWRLQNSPGFGVPLSTIAFAILYLSVPIWLLAGLGWIVAKSRRTLATVLIAALAIWPLYHLLTQDPVGTNKHLVFGFIFGIPLVGLALARIWDVGSQTDAGRISRRVATVAIVSVLAGLGALQVYQANHAWPNLAFAADFLTERVTPGDQLLINESWPITMALYTAGRINSPWDVYDTYRVATEPTAPAPCDFEWMVDVRGSYTWTPEVAAALEACPDYRRVYAHTSLVINPGADFRYVSYPVETIIWQRLPEEP
jgi:hypothetical protein